MLHAICKTRYFHDPANKWQIYSTFFSKLHGHRLQSINYLINQWCCFIEKAAFSEPVSVSPQSCWMIEHQKPSLSLPIASSHHCNWACVLPTPRVPQGHLHPPLLSTTELWLLWQPCCHGSIYFSADLDRGWLHIQLSVSDQMCHTYTLAWSAAGSRVSADLGEEQEQASNGQSSGSGKAWDEPYRPSDQPSWWDERIVHLLPTTWQAGIENHWLAYENDSIIMEMQAHTEEQDHQFNPKLPDQTPFSFSYWVTLVFNTHTDTHKWSNSSVIADVPPSTGG